MKISQEMHNIQEMLAKCKQVVSVFELDLRSILYSLTFFFVHGRP